MFALFKPFSLCSRHYILGMTQKGFPLLFQVDYLLCPSTLALSLGLTLIHSVLQPHPKGPVDGLIYYWPENIMCTYSLEGRGF